MFHAVDCAGRERTQWERRRGAGLVQDGSTVGPRDEEGEQSSLWGMGGGYAARWAARGRIACATADLRDVPTLRGVRLVSWAVVSRRSGVSDLPMHAMPFGCRARARPPRCAAKYDIHVVQ